MENGDHEVMGCKHYTQITKGKRTKRQRHSSPPLLTMASTSSSSAEDANSISGGGGGGGGGGVSDSSVEFTRGAGEEEEDMANCLILLAQGQTPKPSHLVDKLYVYQCKTCDRCFPSFQALGGHRASHNRPKPTLGERKQEITGLSLQISDRGCLSAHNRSKVHECSICGTGFASGQALGGHMRRHRATTAMASGSAECQDPSNPRSILSLDLNLPAPEADHRPECKLFPSSSKQKVMVFSASPLVDCHY